MGAKVSAEMKHALFLVLQEGKAVKASARLAGVDASSVYKALRRIDHGSIRNVTTTAVRGELSSDLGRVGAH